MEGYLDSTCWIKPSHDEVVHDAAGKSNEIEAFLFIPGGRFVCQAT